MKKCGLLGRHLTHSYSPQIHALLEDYSYELFEKEPEELGAFLKEGDWDGINVTVPYKKDVIPYLDELSPIAQRLGAVNTIVRRNGKLIGHNTDYFGFLTMVKSAGLEVAGKKALVLGSGGASNTAVAVLEELGANVIVVSRSGVNHYGNLHMHQDASILVNTTPIGMFPHTGYSLVDLDVLPNLEGVLDVIYNPARTALLLDAEKRNLITMNGLLMLVAQAKEAAQWFAGTSISNEVIPSIVTSLRRQMENIILIGMPGCGKSTVGHLLAKQLGKTFADADDQTAAIAGMPIPVIFERCGEDTFRDHETSALQDLGMQSALVIATGGGCVKKERNYPLLHQNGTIIWLKRDISQLPTEGRPLSKQQRLEEMYHTRAPLYAAFADLEINNDGDPDDTVRQIIAELEARI